MSLGRVRSRVARLLGFVVAGAALLGLFVYFRHRSVAPNAAECRLNVPNSTIDPWVFPNRAGSAALDAAIIADAEPAVIRRLLHEQGGFSVPHGTACTELETGPVYSRVLLTEGSFAGKAVWVPAAHTHG